MSKFRTTIILAKTGFIFFILSSCSLFYTKTDSSNFRDRAVISLSSDKFFSAKQRAPDKITPHHERKKEELYKYEYREMSDCNLPFENILCQYEMTSQLKMESISIRLMDEKSFFNFKTVKDYLYLIASEVTIQRGFSKFIVYLGSDNSGCSSSKTAVTDGIIASNSYSSTTSFNSSVSCTGSAEISFLAFDDYSLIKNGVFFQGKPFKLLYQSYQNTGGRFIVNGGAWKTYYEASEMVEKLRCQYGARKNVNYRIVIKGESESISIDNLGHSK